MRNNTVMKYLAILFLLFGLTFLTSLIYLLDHALGLVAYTAYFLSFCAVVALVFGAVWFASIRKYSLLAGLVALAAVASHVVLPPPSERLLRAAMLSVPLGADVDTIETAVQESYQGSRYALPQITTDVTGGMDRVHVSLLSQERGNCTAIVFLVKDGRVVNRFFSPD
jgi:hypothetical protein